MFSATPSRLRATAVHRRSFNLAAAVPFSAAEAAGDVKPRPSPGGATLARAVAGIAAVLGSVLGLGFLPCPSFPNPSLSFADSASGQQVAEPERKPRFLLADSYRRRVFFNYEKRMRTRSPPEKIFEYFASVRNREGDIFMTPADFMRAVVPVFPPSDSNIVREGYLRGERPPGELHCAPSTFFMLFDTNNDGLISFSEYIFFVTLLSIPESSFSVAFKMFDLDKNGEIGREEFKKVMTLMRSYNRQGSCHRDGLRIGLRVGRSVENAGLVEYFFGKDGKGCLQHDKFVQFLRELHDEIVRLEFAHYDFKSRGTISAKDFALSIVSSADINHISKFLSRVDELNNNPNLRERHISFEEFKAFAELRRRFEPLALALFSYGKINGLLTKQDFKRAAFHVCGVSVTDSVVDVIFHVFDANRDGNLSVEEFLRSLHRRESDICWPTMTGVMGRPCWLDSTRTCSPAVMAP